MNFSEDFELRFEFECQEDKFSSGYLNLSDLLKNNKFTFSQFGDFENKNKDVTPENKGEMYTIGDEVDSVEDSNEASNEDPHIQSTPIKLSETYNTTSENNDNEEDDEEFDQELDDDEYFKKLEEDA